MAFQRSYSKVWWGSDNQLPSITAAGSSYSSGGGSFSFYTQHQHQHQQQPQPQAPHQHVGGYHSLDYNNFKPYAGNLSRIQEVDDEQNISKLSWEKHDSPGSLRSQDSGFSDNDESHSTRSLSGRSSKTGSPSAKSNVSVQSADSPNSVHSVETPPTVVRRVGKSAFYSPLVNVSRRISFSGTATPAATANREQEAANATVEEGVGLLAQLDGMQLVQSPARQLDFDGSASSGLSTAATGKEVVGASRQRRRRRVSRQATKPLTPTKRRTLPANNDEEVRSDAEDGNSFDELDKEDSLSSTNSMRSLSYSVPEYNNETVYLGEAPQPYNNETVILGGPATDDANNSTLRSAEEDLLMSPLKQTFTGTTSTPKAATKHIQNLPQLHYFECYEFEHPLLNGHPPALQSWLTDMRLAYDHEVMSTLQTKSIAQEAFKNLTITTNTVAKLIRQLQQRALYMQSDFERMERMLTGALSVALHEALASAEQLVENIDEFTRVLERRAVFFTDSRADRKRYEDTIEQIRIIARDTRYSLARQHYIHLESLLDDVQVLKRYLLIAIRLVFEKMVRVIVQSVEQGRCDLMLRANINMIATLSNIDYDGFASLTDAFVHNEAVRTLLMVCLEHKVSSVRALALRALATVCCAPAAIAQLGASGGVDILRDILQVQRSVNGNEAVRRSDTERREAVSLLTQLTAAWHGPDHRVNGLRDCVESVVEGLTQVLLHVSCSQTLLLCAAALNNLSRMEVTSHHSIMSHESIFKMIDVVADKDRHKEEAVSIFLYEQIVAMLHNMSLNKKCHSHLANGSIINFITSVYEAEFYKRYESRAEGDAQRRTIKAILHTLTRLVQDSSLGIELLEQRHIPAFFKMVVAATSGGSGGGDPHAQCPLDGSHHARDISQLARQLLQAQRKDAQLAPLAEADTGTGNMAVSENAVNAAATLASLKFNLTRQESYV